MSEKTATRDKVYSILSKAIFQGDLVPGERLVELKLARLMKISRTPVREAIIELEQKGLVVPSPPKGVKVAPLPTEANLSEFYDIRGVLRGLVVRKAAKNISSHDIKKLEEIIAESEVSLEKKCLKKVSELNLEFHKIIERNSQNKELVLLLDNLYKKARESFSEIISSIERQKEALKEHKMIVNALIKQDEQLVEKIMRIHAENAKRALEDEITGHQ